MIRQQERRSDGHTGRNGGAVFISKIPYVPDQGTAGGPGDTEMILEICTEYKNMMYYANMQAEIL